MNWCYQNIIGTTLNRSNNKYFDLKEYVGCKKEKLVDNNKMVCVKSLVCLCSHN